METQEYRREELAARFAARAHARDEERRRRRAAARAEDDPSESTERFNREFFQNADAIRARIGDLGSHKSPGSELSLLKSECRDMELSLSDAMRFLPAYDAKRAQETLDAVRREIEDAQEQHAPRPRFRFKSRADVEARRVKGHDQSARDEEEAANAAATSAQLEKAAAARTGAAGADETVFADETGKELAIRPGELARAGKGGDVRLRNLEDCVVSLCDTVTSLHVIGLRRCHVYVGAVVSSTMMDDCVDCTVMVGSGQIRVHQSTRCDLYLRVRSNPIIEHCSGIRVAPFALTYLQLRLQQEAAGLADCDPDMWRRVHDFNWHRVQQSPNWAELPEAERARTVRDPELAIAGEEGVVVRAAGEGAKPAGGTAAAETAVPAEGESSDEEL